MYCLYICTSNPGEDKDNVVIEHYNQKANAELALYQYKLQFIHTFKIHKKGTKKTMILVDEFDDYLKNGSVHSQLDSQFNSYDDGHYHIKENPFVYSITKVTTDD